jgi:hypothetical protein
MARQLGDDDFESRPHDSFNQVATVSGRVGFPENSVRMDFRL